MSGDQVAGAQLYSQPTSGFYSALPGSVNNKFDTNAIDMLWSRLDLSLSKNTSMHNLTYFDHEHRLHYTTLHDYVPAASQSTDPALYENNTPTSYVFGDKLWTEFNLPYNDFVLGAYIQASRYHSIEELYNPLYTQGGAPGSPTNSQGKYFSDLFWQVDSAMFVQDKISPLPTLHITPGLRFANYYVSFSHDEAAQFSGSVANNPGGNQSLYPAATKDFNVTEPSLGINWEASKHLSLYTSYARSYRLPEFGGGTGPFVQIPASGVAMERGDYTQAGVLYHTPRVGMFRDADVGFNVYQLKFSNETLPTALASGGALLAYGSSTYRGINAFTHFSTAEGTTVFANTGLINATFNNFTNSTGTLTNMPVPNVPHITGNFGISRNIFMGEYLIKPLVVYQYTGSQHIFDNNQNQTSNILLPAYGVVNASTEFSMPYGTLMGKQNRITFNLSVDNLLGHQYNAFEYVSAGGTLDANSVANGGTQGAVLALPAPPRTIFASVGTKF
jgi:iron complex outermembrane receptor protein